MAVDLSLIRVFCAIYEARGVSRAAAALELTQPALSYSLSLLRTQLGDPLFTRNRTGMSPTPFADTLYVAFSRALQTIDEACSTLSTFDSRTSNRRFRIAMSDIGEMVYLPPLLSVLRTEAPAVAIEVLLVSFENTLRALAAEQVDFAIGYLPGLAPHTESASIFTERFVCMFRPGHPFIRKTLSLDKFQRCGHVMVSSSFSRLNVFVDILAEKFRRNMALQVVHFTSVPAIVAQTDLVVTLPSRVARIFASTHHLRSLPVPLDIPSFQVRLHWHARAENDRGHQWMRELMVRVLSKL
jgi:DNA-binding transcriptional LysR family regulator